MLPFYIRFERKAFVSREIVLVAAAIALVSAIFDFTECTTDFIRYYRFCNRVWSETGFMIGATARLCLTSFRTRSVDAVANVFMGMIGFIAGLLRNTFLMKSYGEDYYTDSSLAFIWLDHEFLGTTRFYTGSNVGNSYFILYRKFYFDLSHAISNVVFLLLFSTSWITILTRFKRKYGILDKHNMA